MVVFMVDILLIEALKVGDVVLVGLGVFSGLGVFVSIDMCRLMGSCVVNSGSMSCVRVI